MLTLKLITEETERVIKGLEKKHFQGAKEAVEQAIAIDKQRREAQTKLDAILAESKKYAAQIGQLMKAGKKDEAEAAKQEVAKLKAEASNLEAVKQDAEQRHVLASVCDNPSLCDFTSPAIFRQGDLTVAVSSDAKDVRRSMRIRDVIQDNFSHLESIAQPEKSIYQ